MHCFGSGCRRLSCQTLSSATPFKCSLIIVKVVAIGIGRGKRMKILRDGSTNCCDTNDETLPKALRTQALTALTSNFGSAGLLQYAW